jgi:hypothetical protein
MIRVHDGTGFFFTNLLERTSFIERKIGEIQNWLTYLSKWFYDTFIDTATRAACCGSFVREGLGLSDVSYRGTRRR